MAFCDYHPCDNCGEHKTFYDADMHFGPDEDGVLVYGGWDEGGVMEGGYRAYALCHICVKTHKIVIKPREEDND